MTRQTSRPRRQKKHDRLTQGFVDARDIQCDMALAPFDKAMRDVERKWGIDRLPELVSTSTAEKWGMCLGRLNEAIAKADPEETRAWSETCIRGLAKMEAEAEAAGQPHSDPHIWEYEYQGHRFGIIQDGREWPAAQAGRPDLTIYSMQEVAVAIQAHNQSVVAVKASFPGAEVTAIRKKVTGDPIPFGNQQEAAQ